MVVLTFHQGFPMLRFLFLFCLSCSFLFAADDITFIAEVDGSEQKYVQVMPEGYKPGQPVDVLIALHGHGSDRWQFIRQNRDECRAVRDVAKQYGMILVSPDYRARTSWMGPKAEADLVQIIQDVKARHPVRRVYLTGASMGGASCLTFAALHPHLLDGVASMNGTANHLEYENFQTAIQASFGGAKSEVPEEYQKRSAELHPEKFTMPTAFTVGGKDKSVPPESVLRLARKLEAMGKPVLLLHRKDGGHSTNYADAVRILEYVISASPSTEPQRISSIGSERATSGSGGKIVTFEGKTHVVWQDAKEGGGYFNMIRSLDHETGKWSEPVTLNRGKDNHARPVIAVDREGYLHVVLSGHNSPVTYRRSVKPNDASEWTKAETVGNGTYPVVTCTTDGTLLVTMRASPRWNGVDLFVKEPGKAWTKSSKLVIRDPKMPGYAGYQTGFAWGPEHKMLHFVVDFYESYHTYKARGAHQAVCYMRSPDGGKTWQKAYGDSVKLPARPEDMDILGRHIGPGRNDLPPPVILAQGSLVVDRKGVPHVLYISHQEKPGQVVIASPAATGTWQRRFIHELPNAWPEHRPIGCRGAFTIDAEGNEFALLELKPLSKGWKEGKPSRSLKFSEEGKKLVWVYTKDGGKNYSTKLALPEKTIVNQPNVERSAGFNQIHSGGFPPFLFFDGSSRYRKGKEVIQNNVFFVRN